MSELSKKVDLLEGLKTFTYAIQTIIEEEDAGKLSHEETLTALFTLDWLSLKLVEDKRLEGEN